MLISSKVRHAQKRRTDCIGVDQRGSNHRLRVKYIVRQASRRDVGRQHRIGGDAAQIDTVGLACEPVGKA
jgi:hypothetical protein